MTVTQRAVRRFDLEERVVYQAAIDLTRRHPAGFTAEDLAEVLSCPLREADEWCLWLRQTGDFGTEAAQA